MSAPNDITAFDAVPLSPATLSITGYSWQSALARAGRVPLTRLSIHLGRMPDNDIVLDDPHAARHHAVIRWTTGGYTLEDLGTASGTYLADERVQGVVPLTPGAAIRIGTTGLIFHLFEPHVGGDTPVLETEQSGHDLSPEALRLPKEPRPDAGALQQLLRNTLGPWALAEARRSSWRTLLLGVLAYAVVALALATSRNPHLLPLALALGSGLLALVFIVFCAERGALRGMPTSAVGTALLGGGVVGMSVATVVEPLFLPGGRLPSELPLSLAVLIALTEETAKLTPVLWFLRDKRLRSELDGLLLGALAGIGFATCETAGYGYSAFANAYNLALRSHNGIAFATQYAIGQMSIQIGTRLVLTLAGHAIWTALICAAIWRDRGVHLFRLTTGVLGTFALAIALHALWDWSPLIALLPDDATTGMAVTVITAWYLLLGAAGLFMVRFFVREALWRARLGTRALQPAPLWRALLADTFPRRWPLQHSAPAPQLSPLEARAEESAHH